VSVYNPVYRVEIWSGSTLRHAFGLDSTKYVNSLRVKPGMTTTIGSFEITVPDADLTNNPGMYNNVLPFEDVYIWLGYTNTGSSALLKGKIETIKSNLDPSRGWVRTFIGRDYGECFHRVIKREAFNTGSTVIVQNIRNNCTGSIYGGLSTSNTYIETDTQAGSLTLDNDSCQKGIKEISDFVNRDFYVDTNKVLHWFTRQSQTGSEIYTTGSNIFDYKVTKDMSNVINDIYVFGIRDPAGMTGSDWPTNHDDWTDTGSASLYMWESYVNSGSGNTYIFPGMYALEPATGSAALRTAFDVVVGYPATGSFLCHITGSGSSIWQKSSLMISDNDVLHFYFGTESTIGGITCSNHRVRLETDQNNYFECLLENPTTSGTVAWAERTINLGPTHEGISTTGSANQTTGSYKWQVVGNPDWFNINHLRVLCVGSVGAGSSTLILTIDGVYFGTKFQYHTGSTSSQTTYGYRPYVYTDERLTSNEYCQNKAGTLLAAGSTPVTQIQLTTTGSPALQIGNRHQIVIGAENISGYYELIDIEHNYEAGEFRTTCTFTDKKELRTIVPIINYPVQKAQETLSWWDVLLRQFTRFGPGPYKQYSSP